MLRLRSCLKSITWHFMYYNYKRCGEVEQIALSQCQMCLWLFC